MIEHQQRWAQTPQGLLRYSDWGWRSACTCGWEQEPVGIAGTEKTARRAWYAHAEEASQTDSVAL